MKKCRFKEFLIFTFTVLFLSFVSDGVYAQANVASKIELEGQQLEGDDEVVKAKIKRFQNYIVENCGDYDFDDTGNIRIKPLDVEKYKPDAERLLKVVNDFVKKVMKQK